MFLLDTNVVSELRKRPARRDAHVDAWFRQVGAEATALSVITLLEIEEGILSLARRDPQQAEPYKSWLDQLREDYRGRTFAVDSPVASACARLHVPNPRPERDALIAATALVHEMKVATRDRDFAAMGVPLLNPWVWVQ